MSHAWYCFYTNIYPRWLCLVEVWVMASMLVLFTRFYRKSYAKKDAAAQVAIRYTRARTMHRCDTACPHRVTLVAALQKAANDGAANGGVDLPSGRTRSKSRKAD
jgi:hypothetical protein